MKYTNKCKLVKNDMNFLFLQSPYVTIFNAD